MNKIYVIAIPTGSVSYIRDADPSGDTYGVAIRDDGVVVARHYSSCVGWSKHDMGITSNWKHSEYEETCPDGYELEWVDFESRNNNEGFMKAVSLVKDEFPYKDRVLGES